MATTKTGIGVLALVTGVVIGALGMFVAKKEEEPEGGVLIIGFHDDSEGISEGDESGAQGTGDNDEFEDHTPDNTTLIDSLEGIEVPGEGADLLKVRVLGIERAKMVAMWGSKGQDHTEPTKFQRLVDLTTEHLVNIKANSSHVTDDERRLIDSLLEDRVAAGEADADVLGI